MSLDFLIACVILPGLVNKLLSSFQCVCCFGLSSFLKEYKKQFDLAADVALVQRAHPEM